MTTIFERQTAAWQACLDETWQAALAGSVPIGAVITGPDGAVISRGHNHIVSHPGGRVDGNQLAHAELNALLGINKGTGLDVHACQLYTAVEPCPLCLGAWYMSGLRMLRYASRDPYAGSANLIGASDYLRRKPVKASGPHDPELEILIMGLHAAHVVGRYGGVHDIVLDTWQQELPAGVALGRRLVETGLLARLCASRCPAGEAFAALESLARAEDLLEPSAVSARIA